MDERQNQIIGKAAGITFIITYFYVLIECIYKYLSTWNINNCSWEIGLLVLMPVSFLFFAKKDDSLLLPRTINNKEMNFEMTSAAKKSRIIEYTKEALLFSIVMLAIDALIGFLGNFQWSTFIDIINSGRLTNYILYAIYALLGQFIISFVIDYSWSEYKIKKYNKMLDEMESE